MKKIKTIAIILLLIPLKFYGQCLTFSIQTTAASCSTCCDGTASVENLTGGCPPFYSFLWSGGNQLGNATTELCWGNYFVVISVPDSCCTNPDTIAYCLVGFLNDINEKYFSNIKANIADNNLLIIENLIGNEFIELYDIVGKKIFNKINNNTTVEINLNSLSKQIYLLNIKDKNNRIVFQDKIIW